MELASVTRLFKDQSTQKAILLLEAVGSKERFKITLPGHRAGILALEGHGLNDRCTLYGILSECVDLLGGSFTSVKITLDKTRGVSGAISLAKGEDLKWVKTDVIELVAFALHVQIPIFLNVTDEPKVGEPRPERANTDLPSVFENVLTEIMCSKPEPLSPSTEDDGPDSGREFQFDLDSTEENPDRE